MKITAAAATQSVTFNLSVQEAALMKEVIGPSNIDAARAFLAASVGRKMGGRDFAFTEEQHARALDSFLYELFMALDSKKERTRELLNT